MPRILYTLLIGIAVAGLGCYLASVAIPAGPPRLCAQMLAVAAGVAPAVWWRE